MLNRPFSSYNTHVVDETRQNTTPANLYGQNVLLSQEQHQKILNTLTTSIAGMPGPCPVAPQIQPNTVTFSFNQTEPYYPQEQYYSHYWQCPPGQQTNPALFQNLNQMQMQNAWDLAQLQGQMSQQYACKFHIDNQTSTSDLLAKSFERPDLRNLAGMLKSKWPYWLQTPIKPNQKKLILKTVTAEVEGNIYDNLDANHQDIRKVTFDLDQKKDFECQVNLCCQNCDDVSKINKKHRRNKHRKSSTDNSDEGTSDDDATEHR